MPISAFIATARALHFASAMLLLGGLVFTLAIRCPTRRSRSAMWQDEHIAILGVAGWSLAGSIVSAVVWLALEAASMSGLALGEAMSRNTLARVLGNTNFGRAWLLRLALAVICAMLLFAMQRSIHPARARRLALSALAIAGVYLAALAWTGHASATEGQQRYLHLCSDVVHLLAAGAWLGALFGLVLFLGRSPRLDDATRVVRRFSTMGVCVVAALAATGTVNAWFLVGSVPALVGTDYGRLLLAKLALFAAMFTLAAVNRLALAPRLARHDDAALRTLHRNAILEFAIGTAIVAIVGVLGITIPAAHQSMTNPASMPDAPMH